MEDILNYIFDEIKINVIVDKNNEIWFRAIDVCRALNIKDHKKTIQDRIYEEDKIQFQNLIKSKNDSPTTIYITESGLYTLILKSKKMEAIKFQKWVTQEVIPSIRKNGYYKLKKEISSKISQKYNKIINKIKEELEQKNHIIYKLSRNLSNQLYEKKNSIYIFKYDNYTNHFLFKIGSSKNINNRKMTLDTSLPDGGTIVYHVSCFDCKLVERVLKHKLKYSMYLPNKEFIEMELNDLIKIIDETIYDLDNKIIKDRADELVLNAEESSISSNE